MWWRKAQTEEEWKEYQAYHGTREPELTWGDLEPREPSYKGSLGEGIYLGQERETASTYGDNILEGKVRFRNPLIIDAENETNYRQQMPSAYDESWTEFRVTDDLTGEVLYDGNDEEEARRIEDENPNATKVYRVDTDDYVPESVLVGEHVTPFDIFVGGEWHQIRTPYDLSSIANLAKAHGHDGLVTRKMRSLTPDEEMLAFNKDQLFGTKPPT